ncbi:zinc finger (CCCH-type) family protein [Monoraphidium neglectum]|uniref:Zinc finger (CCCH-type) family protein n=1 Tax=Monoraphidium neglectum TaxID=145388 RepID=A0A0D2L6R4_9CHLO|nr:zinc finger (CCCH-type) family protein [Monoraphidium neglectum]KIZ02589.1 zinc finger (CCCH-type) family protein [Monoraphidium neglectum]|eukprot:XP_013901608.1 zinc finger (CCCH-type) family protein [Monoraphidium neglectum]
MELQELKPLVEGAGVLSGPGLRAIAAIDDSVDLDEFRMFSFKILPCSRRTSHDWTSCPFAHPGEKARRRDPRLFSYLAVPCPDVKQRPD